MIKKILSCLCISISTMCMEFNTEELEIPATVVLREKYNPQDFLTGEMTIQSLIEPEKQCTSIIFNNVDPRITIWQLKQESPSQITITGQSIANHFLAKIQISKNGSTVFSLPILEEIEHESRPLLIANLINRSANIVLSGNEDWNEPTIDSFLRFDGHSKVIMSVPWKPAEN